jgi:WD40 repeat protein
LFIKIFQLVWVAHRLLRRLAGPQGFAALNGANTMGFSPDGLLFATVDGPGPEDEFVRVWKVSTGAVEKDIAESDASIGLPSSMGFTFDGRLFYTRSIALGSAATA